MKQKLHRAGGHRTDRSDRTDRTDEKQAAPTCPLCGGDMALRTASKGPRSGEHFWGCRAFPECRGIRPCVAASQPPSPSRAPGPEPRQEPGQKPGRP